MGFLYVSLASFSPPVTNGYEEIAGVARPPGKFDLTKKIFPVSNWFP